jgi:sensor c-di-GMP phosphodiesterase-like protein
MIAWFKGGLLQHHLTVSIFLGLIVAIASFAVSLKIVTYAEVQNLKITGELFRGNVQTADRTTTAVFEYVKELEGPPCGPETLRALRTQVYHHYILRDVAVFEEESPTVVCTAQIGPLPKPFLITETPRSNPATPGRMIWNLPKLSFLPGDPLHHVSKEGRFGVILDTDILHETLAGNDWQMYARTGEDGFRHHSFGNENLYDAWVDSQTSILLPHKVVGRVCLSETHVLCILVARPIGDVIWDYSLILVPGLLLSILLGMIVVFGREKILVDRNSVEGRIRRAMKKPGNSNFTCHYQPVVDLETGEIVGCEVLARYEDQHGGIPPVSFIPIIERSAQTWSFTELVMRRVVEDFQGITEFSDSFRVAINVFPGDLAAANLGRIGSSEALNALRRLGPQIVFEILETSVTDHCTSADTLKHLKETDVEIAIDDFGTGFSNLEQLKAIDTDYLKIDKSFVDELSTKKTSVVGTFVRHIVSLAEELEVRIVAEGIEEREQISMLRDLGVQYGQGFLFSKPVPVREFRFLITRNFYAEDDMKTANEQQVLAAG